MDPLIEDSSQLCSPKQYDKGEAQPQEEEDDRCDRSLQEFGEHDADSREVGHIKSEQPFEDLPEESADKGRNDRSFCVDFDLRNEFVEREKEQKCQSERDEVLEKKIVDQGHGLRIDVVGNKRAFLDDPVDGCPDSGDGQRDQHDDPYDKQQDVFHKPAVEEGFLLVCSEDGVYGIDQV